MPDEPTDWSAKVQEAVNAVVAGLETYTAAANKAEEDSPGNPTSVSEIVVQAITADVQSKLSGS